MINDHGHNHVHDNNYDHENNHNHNLRLDHHLRDHEPLHDHDVHGDEVLLDGGDAEVVEGGAPALLQEQQRLRLR